MLFSASPVPSGLRTWLRRHSLRNLWYRVRLGFRRRRWRRENTSRTKAYIRSPQATYGAEPVLVVGEFNASYGLSRGANYDLDQIRQRHRDVTVINARGLQGAGADQQSIDRNRVYGTVYLMCQPDTYARVLRLFLPQQVAGAYRIGRWVWETPLFPTAWNFAIPLVHEVLSASDFSAESFRQTGLPVKVLHYHVAPPPAVPGGRDLAGVSAGTFLGVAIMDIQSCPERKNPWAHVRAWQRAFGGDPSAVLVIKLRVGKRTRLVVDELQEMIGSATNIRVMTEELTSDQIAALQHAADVYLSLHRSEGFGLNIAECLLIGKPVVATHWSANMEFGPQYPNYHPVTSRQTAYHDGLLHSEDTGFTWAEADVDDAARKLQAIRAKPAGPL